MDCQQCRWDFSASKCIAFGCHNLTSKSTCMAAQCAGQCGHPQMGHNGQGQHCNGTFVCNWDDTQSSCHTIDCGLDITTKDRCDRSVDPHFIGDGE